MKRIKHVLYVSWVMSHVSYTHTQDLEYIATVLAIRAAAAQSLTSTAAETGVLAPLALTVKVKCDTLDITHPYTWHDSSIHVTWLIHKCDMTHLYTWYDSFIHVTWLIHTCDMTHPYTWHDSSTHGTWLIRGLRAAAHYAASSSDTALCCDSFDSHSKGRMCSTWHDSFIRVTWLIHKRDMTHPYAWHDSFIHVTWLIHTRDMTHPYTWHNSFEAYGQQMQTRLIVLQNVVSFIELFGKRDL